MFEYQILLESIHKGKKLRIYDRFLLIFMAPTFVGGLFSSGAIYFINE